MINTHTRSWLWLDLMTSWTQCECHAVASSLCSDKNPNLLSCCWVSGNSSLRLLKKITVSLMKYGILDRGWGNKSRYPHLPRGDEAFWYSIYSCFPKGHIVSGELNFAVSKNRKLRYEALKFMILNIFVTIVKIWQ